ncbi:MAG: redoxin domain-containing protein [Planctomycetales bacterium]|nr:redoxin domain-containing protein [Planctomycetales bacterium]
MRRAASLHILVLVALLAGSPRSAANAAAADGAGAIATNPIPDFTLNDYLGAKRSLSQFSDKPVIVVVFLGTECPLAKLYAGRLAELDRDYRDRGVQVLGINANQQDSLVEIAGYARKHGVEFPVLKDAGGKVAELFGATRTPEAFVLDANRVIRYRGRIDDQYGVGAARSDASEQFVKDAVDALLADEPIATPRTEAVGCFISPPRETVVEGEVTYAQHIAPLINEHCISCHRPGEIAPFTLTNYDDAAAWAETMLETIEDGRMPPWHANPEYGKFHNDARLPEEQKELFRRWVAADVPSGDLAQAPAPPKFVEGWQIGEPDVVYRLPEPVEVPAQGTVPYKYYVVDPGFTEDMWVRAAEARPDNRSVVHHLIMFYMPPERNGRWRGEDALFNAIAAFAPGMPAIECSDEEALRIPAGSKLVFQMHYTPNGTPQTDQSAAGLIFADPDKIRREVKVEAALNIALRIPPGDPDYMARAKYVVRRDMLLYSLTPHMHYRGKSFRFTARYPDGSSEILLDVPRYDFNWQNVYLLAKPKTMPQGTTIDMEAHYDNSADNPFNPNPDETVYWGDQTWEEMLVGSLGMAAADQDLRANPPTIETLDNGRSRVTFRYRPEEPADQVFLAGFFNDWSPTGQPMNGPDDDGAYTTSLELAPGRYEYKYVLDGKHWRADPSTAGRSGSDGNSVIVVK